MHHKAFAINQTEEEKRKNLVVWNRIQRLTNNDLARQKTGGRFLEENLNELISKYKLSKRGYYTLKDLAHVIDSLG